MCDCFQRAVYRYLLVIASFLRFERVNMIWLSNQCRTLSVKSFANQIALLQLILGRELIQADLSLNAGEEVVLDEALTV